MAVMMRLATQRRVMGSHVISPRLRWLGWLATAAMAATVLAMLVSL
jgi:Mn2+/Fe2+ NRAMP family transporter